ncbi:cytochrome P450 [Nocardia sp. NPDC051570]|uniref:cytochrome P450 n=1 Tax=Nocardia sp. NPDC051570 TaxID=3364324 RepID=UPI0037A58E20
MTRQIIDFPIPRPGTMGPPLEYGDLRAHHPMIEVDMGMDATAWYVTRYTDVRALMADPRLIRPTINDWPARSAESDGPRPGLTTMMELDGPRHTALRRAIAGAFSAGSIRIRSARLGELADGLLTRLRDEGPPGDLVAGFTDPFPLLAMCDLVGIPPEDCDQFVPVVKSGFDAMVTPEEARRTADLLRDHMAGLIDRKRRKPEPDIMTHLVDAWQAEQLSYEDVMVFGLSMVTAGFGTSSMFLANAVVALLSEPGQYARLREHRDLMPTAAEELLRYVPMMNGMVILLATEDIELHGSVIRKGDAVLPVLAAANRDDTVFTDPDRLDLSRAVNPHLMFGRGAHNCVGAHSARSQLTVALTALLDRFPQLRLIDDQPPAWNDESPTRSPLTLPVSW